MKKKITYPATPNIVPLGAAEISPGEILSSEFMIPMELTQAELARRAGLPRMAISAIVRGNRAITASTAIKLANVFGNSAQFWMNLQTAHDLAKVAKTAPTKKAAMA